MLDAAQDGFPAFWAPLARLWNAIIVPQPAIPLSDALASKTGLLNQEDCLTGCVEIRPEEGGGSLLSHLCLRSCDGPPPLQDLVREQTE